MVLCWRWDLTRELPPSDMVWQPAHGLSADERSPSARTSTRCSGRRDRQHRRVGPSAVIGICRDKRWIEHAGHSTRDRQKRRFAEISPVGEWSSGRTPEASETDRVIDFMENKSHVAQLAPREMEMLMFRWHFQRSFCRCEIAGAR